MTSWPTSDCPPNRDCYRIAQRSSSLPPENKLMAELGETCADGRNRARALVYEITNDRNTSTSTRWQAWMVFGDPRRAYAFIRPLDQPSHLPTLVQYMAYPDFDARQFPLLNAERVDDGVRRPAVVEAPYTCRTARAS